MKRGLLTLMLAWFLNCGCAGRMDADLLQARIREQAAQLAETQRDFAKTRSELKRTRIEADRLKSELAQVGHGDDIAPQSIIQISKLHVYALASGGLNKDDLPGDDAVVVQFVPVDSDNEPIKVPGQVEFTLFDPLLPESDRELGRWSFSTDECRSHWTRGLTSSGFQFSLPLERSPLHTDLVVHLKFRTSDDQRYDVSHIVKVVLPTGNTATKVKRPRPKPIQVDDQSDEYLPPVGDGRDDGNDLNSSDWASDEHDDDLAKPGHTVLHSSNWNDATIPRLR